MTGVHQKKRIALPAEHWRVTQEQDALDRRNVVRDMEPWIIQSRKEELKKTNTPHGKQPFLSLEIHKVPRYISDKIEIAKILKCMFCKKFPSPSQYYFCGNKAEAHILCKDCFVEVSPTPTCIVDIPLQNENYKRSNRAPNTKTKKCGMPFRPGRDPLYDLVLQKSIFNCVFCTYGCGWTGLVDQIQDHAKECERRRYFFNKRPCPVTACQKNAKSNAALVKHLTEVHKSVVVPKKIPYTSLLLKWIEDGEGENCVWVPGIVQLPGLDVLVTLELRSGILFKWLYVLESDSGKKRTDLEIKSGFRDNKCNTVDLQKEIPKFLDMPPDVITGAGGRRKCCFSIEIEDFMKKHLKTLRKGSRSFMIDIEFKEL